MSISEAQGLISEHESRQGETKAAGYQPTPEEQKAIKMVEMCFSKSKNARKTYDQKWVDYYRMFRGHQWKEQRPSYRHSEVINMIFRVIQSQVPLLTDALPKPEFIPQNPNDFELAKILNDVLESDWTYNNWSYRFAEILYDSHIYGTGLGEIGYNPEACGGIGGVEFKSSDPFYQYPDPSAKNVNEESRHFCEAKPVDIEVLKQKYPDVAQFLKPDLTDLMKRDKEMSDQVRYVSPNNDRMALEGTSPYQQDGKSEALEVTLYIKDTETVEEELREIDPSTGEEKVSYLQKMKYPLGRKIVTISKVLCEDRPMDEMNEPEGKFPRIRLQNYIDPRSFWGISEIEPIESPQKVLNKVFSFALDVLTLMGNPIWKVPSDCNVDTDNLINRPGLIVEYDGPNQPTREEGVQLQPYVLQIYEAAKAEIDNLSGDNDVSRGVKPEGVTAASAIEALQEAQRTRQRQKSRNIDAFMQEFGQQYLGLVFANYTAPRIFRITDNQNVSRYFKFHIDNVTDPVTMEMKQIARFSKFSKNEIEGSPDFGKYFEGSEDQYEIQGRFDIKVSTGSALPFEKSRSETQSYNLFDRGIIDAEEVLKRIDYPNYQSVLGRMAQKALADQQAQMAASAPPGAPEAPPPAPIPA